MLLTISCREKEEGTDELRPPLGVAFRISSGTPSGVISFFNLESGAVVAQEPMEHWAIVASEICPAARWVAVAEGRYNRMALFSLPSLLVLGSVAVGGAPVDVEASPTGHALFGITRNGTFWIGTLSSGELDTLEVKVNPRRMMLRPPGRTEAWVVCPGDCTLHVIDTQQRIKLDTLQFDAPPSDITFTPDGSKVFVGFNGTPGRIAEFDVALQESLSCWEMGRGPWDLSVSLDGCYLAAADSLGGTLYVYDLTAGRWYSTPVDSAAIRVRYSAYNATWFVLSQAGQRLQRVVLEGDSAVVEGSVWMEPTISDFVIWE